MADHKITVELINPRVDINFDSPAVRMVLKRFEAYTDKQICDLLRRSYWPQWRTHNDSKTVQN